MLLVPLCPAADSGQSVTAKTCGVDLTQAPQKVFEDPEGKSGWHEYKNLKEVADLSLEGGEAAMVWIGHDGKLLVRTYEPGEDFAVYTDYCYDKDGTLQRFRY